MSSQKRKSELSVKDNISDKRQKSNHEEIPYLTKQENKLLQQQLSGIFEAKEKTTESELNNAQLKRNLITDIPQGTNFLELEDKLLEEWKDKRINELKLELEKQDYIPDEKDLHRVQRPESEKGIYILLDIPVERQGKPKTHHENVMAEINKISQDLFYAGTLFKQTDEYKTLKKKLSIIYKVNGLRSDLYSLKKSQQKAKKIIELNEKIIANKRQLNVSIFESIKHFLLANFVGLRALCIPIQTDSGEYVEKFYSLSPCNSFLEIKSGKTKDSDLLGVFNSQGVLHYREVDSISLVEQSLQLYIVDPLEYLSSIGKKVGKCMICLYPLTDKKSIELGMGPNCRERFSHKYD